MHELGLRRAPVPEHEDAAWERAHSLPLGAAGSVNERLLLMTSTAPTVTGLHSWGAERCHTDTLDGQLCRIWGGSLL